MCRTYRVKREFRDTGISGLIFFGLLLAYGSYVVATKVPDDKKWGASLFAIVPWSLAVVASVSLLVVYRRERVLTSSERIVLRGVFGRKDVVIREITSARWRSWPKLGSVALKSATSKLTISFERYEREQRGPLVMFFRSTIPESVQHGWSIFCHKHESLIQKEPLAGKEIDDGMRLTRGQVDWCLGAGLVIVVFVAVLWRWFMGHGAEWSPIVAALVAWLSIRFAVPKRGVSLKKLLSALHPTKSLLLAIIWCAMGIGAYRLYGVSHSRLTWPRLTFVTGAVIYVAVTLLVWLIRQRRARGREQQ